MTAEATEAEIHEFARLFVDNAHMDTVDKVTESCLDILNWLKNGERVICVVGILATAMSSLNEELGLSPVDSHRLMVEIMHLLAITTAEDESQ